MASTPSDLEFNKKNLAEFSMESKTLEVQIDDLRQLHQLSSRLSSTMDIEIMLKEILDAALIIHDTEKGLLSLCNPECETLKVKVSAGFTDDFLKKVDFVAIGGGSCGMNYQAHERVIVEDVETDETFKKYREAAQIGEFRAVHSTPLFTREGKIIGVLSVHFRKPRRPTSREIYLMDLYTRQAMDVLESARLRDQLMKELSVKRINEENSLRLAAIVEFSSDAIIGKNLQGIITNWNKSAEQIFGYTAEEMIGKSILTLIPVHLQSEEKMILGRIVAGEPVKHFETIRQRKDGVLINISLTVSPIKNERGEVIGASKIARDITEQKKTEEALRRSENLYRAIGESIKYGIWICDANGKNIYASDSFLKLVGMTQEECSEFGWGSVLHPDDADETIRAWKEVSQTGNSWEHEHRFKGVDGKWHPILARGVPIRDEKGQLVCWVGINLDISKFKKTEEDNENLYQSLQRELVKHKESELALRESETKFRQLADSMPQMVWTARPDGYVDYYNQRWYDYTGIPENIHGDLSWKPVLHPDDFKPCYDTWYSSVETGKDYKVEYRFKDKGTGGYRWFLIRALPIKDEEGKVVRWFGTCTDIDEQKKNQQELSRSNKELEEFAYVASHDLQEPLQMVNSFVELLTVKCGQKFTDKEREYFEFITQGATQAKTLINELLDYSRIGRREGDVHQIVNLQNVMREVLANLKVSIESSEAKIECADLPHIKASHLEMVQLFQNLISNAIKYKSDKTPKIKISGSRTNTMWQFEVQDNGIGIEPQYKERIFRMFQRLHTKSKYSGTGIGLAVCKKIVEHHGGRIWVESTPNKGSTFYFTIEDALKEQS